MTLNDLERSNSLYFAFFHGIRQIQKHYLCKNDWWGRPLLPEILDQSNCVGAKSPIFDLFSLVATQP